MRILNLVRNTEKGLMGIVLLTSLSGCNEPSSQNPVLRTSQVEQESAERRERRERIRTEIEQKSVISATPEEYPKEDKEITLNIGERNGDYYFVNSESEEITLAYCGLVNHEVFSIATCYRRGYSGGAFNLYYPINSKRITIDNKTFQVSKLNLDSITLIEE